MHSLIIPADLTNPVLLPVPERSGRRYEAAAVSLHYHGGYDVLVRAGEGLELFQAGVDYGVAPVVYLFGVVHGGLEDDGWRGGEMELEEVRTTFGGWYVIIVRGRNEKV